MSHIHFNGIKKLVVVFYYIVNKILLSLHLDFRYLNSTYFVYISVALKIIMFVAHFIHSTKKDTKMNYGRVK